MKSPAWPYEIAALIIFALGSVICVRGLILGLADGSWSEGLSYLGIGLTAVIAGGAFAVAFAQARSARETAEALASIQNTLDGTTDKEGEGLVAGTGASITLPAATEVSDEDIKRVVREVLSQLPKSEARNSMPELTPLGRWLFIR